MKNIQKLVNKHGDEAVLEVEIRDGLSFSITGYREETDAELAFRVKHENEKRETRRKMYENLKKEFEGK